jgi:hypothetical protein
VPRFRLTERFNQTLISHLIRYVNAEANDWDNYLQPVVFSYRVTQQASTKFTPFELMYGVKALLPIDLETVADPTEASQVDVMERVTAFATDLNGKREQAKENIGKAQAKQKAAYDLKHRGVLYKVGDMVLRYNRRRDTRMGDKLGLPFEGPYKIFEVLGKGVYRLRKDETVLKQVVNATNLKLWNPPHSPQTTRKRRRNSSVASTSAQEEPLQSSSPTPLSWLPNLNLTLEDKTVIECWGWLNDKIIDAMNKLVALQIGSNPNQSTLLS